MAEYQLHIKQLVDYPRCRIYRQFIRTLIEDRNIRLTGCSYLFYFVALCSYANLGTSYRRIDGVSYTVQPGEWVCTVSEVAVWFRAKHQNRAIAILDYLQKRHYITYSSLGRGKVIKFKINGWDKSNVITDHDIPCPRDDNFFFFPTAHVNELISVGKCSEMDIALDLWMHVIYRDEQVRGSFVNPVVYFRNSTGNPTKSYAELGKRWGISKIAAHRILKKLARKKYLMLIPLPSRQSTIIYLDNYLSTMFNISDVMIDKDEVAMKLNLRASIPDGAESEEHDSISDEQFCVSENKINVSKPHMKIIVSKASKVLKAQGVACCGCPKSFYKLSKLCPGHSEGGSAYELQISCGKDHMRYRFELKITTAENPKHDKGGVRNEG